MQHIPANTRLTAVWPVSLQNQSGCRSISDDDLLRLVQTSLLPSRRAQPVPTVCI